MEHPKDFPKLTNQSDEMSGPSTTVRFPRKQTYAKVLAEQPPILPISKDTDRNNDSQVSKSDFVNLNRFKRVRPTLSNIKPTSPAKRSTPSRGYDKEAHQRALMDWNTSTSEPSTVSQDNPSPRADPRNIIRDSDYNQPNRQPQVQAPNYDMETTSQNDIIYEVLGEPSSFSQIVSLPSTSRNNDHFERIEEESEI